MKNKKHKKKKEQWVKDPSLSGVGCRDHLVVVEMYFFWGLIDWAPNLGRTLVLCKEVWQSLCSARKCQRFVKEDMLLVFCSSLRSVLLHQK